LSFEYFFEETPHRRLGALHHRIGRAEADIHLAAQDRLDRELLVGKRGPLKFEAHLLRPVQRHEYVGEFIRRRLGERNPELFSLRRRRHAEKRARHHRRRDCMRSPSKQISHDFSSQF
jgi:hypothetical protein